MSSIAKINSHVEQILNVLKDQMNSGGMFKASRELFENEGMLMVHMKSLGEELRRWDRAFITEDGVKAGAWDTTLAAELENQGMSFNNYPSLIRKAMDGAGGTRGLRTQLERSDSGAGDRRDIIFQELILIQRQISLILQLNDALMDLVRDHHQLHNPVQRMEERNSLQIMMQTVLAYITNPTAWGHGFQSPITNPDINPNHSFRDTHT